MASWNQPNGRANHNAAPNAATHIPQRWDPAALMNPKAAPKPQAALQQRPASAYQSRPAQQMSFQFEAPGTSPSPIQNGMRHGHNPLLNGNGYVHQNGQAHNANNGGMGSMIERMHNVSEREFAPQPKRRKVESEDEGERNKAQFSGGSGGVLGQYMKDKREEGRKEAAMNGTTSAVDLTATDDSEDVVVTEGPDDKEVCYGRIEGADINAFKVPTPKPGSTSLAPGHWPQIKVMLRRRIGDKTVVVHVVDATREVIGCLDVNTAIGLVPILDSKLNIRTSARILSRPKKADDLQPGSDCSCRYNLDVTLYGPKKNALQIGRHLSQKQLWLRTPLFVEAGIELYNPHSIQKPPQPVGSGARCAGYSSTSSFTVRTVEEIRNDVMGMFDSLEKSENLPEMEPDSRIITPLLAHQKQGLYFMTNKEKERTFSKDEADNSSLWRLRYTGSGQKSYYNVITSQEEKRNPPQVLGGILADMMGLGKTLSILSLIMSSMDQSLEWAKLPPPPPQDDEVTLKRNCKTTLLISPLSTISNWEDQIGQHIAPGSLTYHIYHGPSKIKDIKKLSEFDLVITTYGSVASEFNKRAKKAGEYPLEELNWFRIVLDEAHMIREQSTLQSKAICRLQAQRRWAVTGTPVQNRLEDLGALMKFLRIKPFDDKRGFSQYILAPCKNADPEIIPKLRLLVDTITLRRLKDRIDLPKREDKLIRLRFNHEEQRLYDVFSKNASDRVKILTSQPDAKSLGGRAYVHILQSILRLRLICAHGKELLSDDDLKIMAGINKASAIDLDSDDDDENKPALTPHQAYETYNLMRQTNADNCAMCNIKIGAQDPVDSDGEPKDETVGHMTPCFHIICNVCIREYKKVAEHTSQDKRHTSCSLCNAYIKMCYFALKQGKIDEDENSRSEIKDAPKGPKQLSHYDGPHTKTKALLEDLIRWQVQSEASPDEPPIKSVVFSGWTSHLDLIGIALDSANIPYVRLDGKMTRNARSQAMDTFRSDPSIPVILVSITAGGLGLNLTTANKVYVMEPQYNPAAEAQAIDRVHRLGQKREVTTVRFVMGGSFEEKMLELQEKKKKLASLSLDRDSHPKGQVGREEAVKKRLEDLRSLFK